jgi:hypothetical protein
MQALWPEILPILVLRPILFFWAPASGLRPLDMGVLAARRGGWREGSRGRPGLARLLHRPPQGGDLDQKTWRITLDSFSHVLLLSARTSWGLFV